jgi:hypothetical protein
MDKAMLSSDHTRSHADRTLPALLAAIAREELGRGLGPDKTGAARRPAGPARGKETADAER